ncbi:MAG: lipopolysaccharide heptosyltransferase II [Ferrovum sp. 37-45-19]|jgi:heptosyltransferase-2|uniref:lipopolysaccharide heptosyltransferase II n=1 Tax=Ferrovum sp. JA12 TaxID=1356299 RepID=UPI000702D5A0|nr:lipopolysaccharide heptosyltransferase II [Ferrovum sp. JA12]OYV80186.1 MAG: lipopolysaccharide heptosyltransferase II [Ferrovum sp. 21-44-67]OYV94463.1 MAG: lipopolysaccharide heptosyltransferase II [Ferrovum sp. 37-45-19]OZB32445.1 MAG: lipopolysaccharide heptosyltransferase II [Ferrovum sp. 34-44-207]HQT81639.1 lipopolysaccharide heptosyltransferase II [Ferrovaceae bacterium]KRH78866.1 ADP-heptose--LPS heptosyltransferase 2 [Ferrovum sp. JA12]
MARPAPASTTLKRILIIGASWVGDAVLSQPLLRHLKSSMDCTIDVLAPSWTRGVLERMAEVDNIIDSPLIHQQLNLKGIWLCAKVLKNHYDRAILLPNSLKSALIPWLASIPERIGYQKEVRGILLTHDLKLDKQRYPFMVERFLALSEIPFIFNESLYPKIEPNLSQQQELIRELKLSLNVPAVVLCPGAEYGPAKRWPMEHFRQLAHMLIAENKQIWLMGSNKDTDIAQHILQQIDGPIINLCGKTTLAEAVDLMALAQAVVTNDSGLMHIAAALHRPLVALFGSSSPQFTPPLYAKARVITRHLPCSPCFQRECALGHLHCLTDITPKQVIEELQLLDAGI